MSLSLPLVKIDNYKEKILEDPNGENSPICIYYKYLKEDLKNIWEVNPFAKKNILEINFKSTKSGKFQNTLFININGIESIEIPIIVECIEEGLNFFQDFLDFGFFFEKNRVFLFSVVKFLFHILGRSSKRIKSF